MIHLINQGNCQYYRSQIEDLHRVRKRVFVDELGWRLRVTDGLEFDEYDDERAQNVVAFSEEGDVVMGLRFRPADDHSMLSDHFAEWLPKDVRPLNDGRTWELSRGFCVERGVRRRNLRRKAASMIAPLEIALSNDIDRCVGFTDVRMLNFCYGVGWKLTILGEPKPYAEGIGVAYEVEVSEESVGAMRRMWGLPNPAYIYVGQVNTDMDIHAAAKRHLASRPELEKLLVEASAPVDPAQIAGANRNAAEYYASFGGNAA